jgi:pentatricopeptide repeat protein
VKNGMAKKAMLLFKTIDKPDEVIFCLFFNSCAQVRTDEALALGRQVWSHVSSLHPENPYIQSSVFDMFIKCGDLSNAEAIFARMKRNVVSYGHLMSYYNEHSMPDKTLRLHETMKKEGINADSVTFVLLVDACAQIGLESRCRMIVDQIPECMLSHVQLQSTLIHMWVRFDQSFSVGCVYRFGQGQVGCVDEARQVFHKVDQANPVAYTAMSKFKSDRLFPRVLDV